MKSKITPWISVVIFVGITILCAWLTNIKEIDNSDFRSLPIGIGFISSIMSIIYISRIIKK